MDVYGYRAHRFNQSEELNNPTFNQRPLQSRSYERELPEAHVMPAPTGNPWNMQGLSWGLSSPPQLVQFSAPSMEPNQTISLHCKRRNIDLVPPIPAKQFLTEEKMAAHLSGLHISSDYTEHSSGSFATPDIMEVNMESAHTSISEKVKGHKLVLSEEIKKLKNEPLIPPALIERLEKPCMSLVVWKPNENVLKQKSTEDEDSKSTGEEENKVPKRNGVLVPEYCMDVEM